MQAMRARFAQSLTRRAALSCRAEPSCAPEYASDPRALANASRDVRCDVLYVCGGLYGNAAALATILRAAERDAPRGHHTSNGGFEMHGLWEGSRHRRGGDRGTAAGRDVDIPRATERAEPTKIDGRRRSRGELTRSRKEQRGAGAILNTSWKFWRRAQARPRPSRRPAAPSRSASTATLTSSTRRRPPGTR